MASTTLTSWALLIWNTLLEKGFDPRIPFKQAGLDPAKLGDGQARYRADLMYPLWEETVQLTQDNDIGISVGQHWSATTFHALGYTWLASYSLREAFERLVRYSEIVNNSLVAGLELEGAMLRFSLTTYENPELVHPAGSDAGIAAIITMCRQLAGEQFCPAELQITRPYRSPGVLEAFVGCETSYNNEQNFMFIDARQAEKRLNTGNSNLAMANEQVIIDYLNKLQKQDVVNSVIRSIISELPSGMCSEELIANSLNMNKRTLQRKLKSEGMSFSKILNEVRQKLAIDYMRNSQLSLTEIAYLLGFSDQSNFTRAFRRWTGNSPSSYRNLLEEKAVAGL